MRHVVVRVPHRDSDHRCVIDSVPINTSHFALAIAASIARVAPIHNKLAKFYYLTDPALAQAKNVDGHVVLSKSTGWGTTSVHSNSIPIVNH